MTLRMTGSMRRIATSKAAVGRAQSRLLWNLDAIKRCVQVAIRRERPPVHALPPGARGSHLRARPAARQRGEARRGNDARALPCHLKDPFHP